MYDRSYDQEYGKENEEPRDAGIDIVEFHGSGTVETLADLDGEGDDQYDRENIEKRYNDRMAGLGQPQKDRVQHEDQRDPERTDDHEVQLLVCKTVFNLVVPRQDRIMDPGYK